MECPFQDCRFVPRGPSTVTIRDLMLILTVRANSSALRIPIEFPKPDASSPSSHRRIIEARCRRRQRIPALAIGAQNEKQGEGVERTPLGDLQELLRMNVLHPAGCEVLMSGVEGILGRRSAVTNCVQRISCGRKSSRARCT